MSYYGVTAARIGRWSRLRADPQLDLPPKKSFSGAAVLAGSRWGR